MIAVVGALDAELHTFQDHMEGLRSSTDGPFEYFHGKMAGREIVLTKSGVGKVMAAMSTQKLIDSHSPTHIVFTGIAGALNPNLEIGDLLVGKDFIQHDLDARDLGFPRGEIPYTGLKIFEADPALVQIASSFPSTSGKTSVGRILSGDQFMTQAGKHSHGYLTDELRGAAIEMEGASVAVVCTLNKVPFIVLRTISDRANDGAALDFQSFLPIASRQSLEVIKYILGALPA